MPVADGASEYDVRFEARTLDDIRALDDGREDEVPFRTLAKVSETNQGLYRQLVSPWIQAIVTPQAAETLRLMHPHRQTQLWLSDLNPWMAGVKWLAEQTRENRTAAPPDNLWRAMEAANADQLEAAIERLTEARDHAVEQYFKAV